MCVVAVKYNKRMKFQGLELHTLILENLSSAILK